MKDILQFIESCIKTRVFKYRGRINIITEEETIRVLKIIEEMIDDGRKEGK